MDKKAEILKFICDHSGLLPETVKANYNWVIPMLEAYAQQIEESRWVRVETEPEVEGEYLCCIQRFITTIGMTTRYFVADFKFNRYRETNELVGADQDGNKGCWAHKNGYAAEVTHYQPLPAPPKH